MHIKKASNFLFEAFLLFIFMLVYSNIFLYSFDLSKFPSLA